MNLEQVFVDLCLKYSNDSKLIHLFWDEINFEYSTPNRHYHSLIHLESIIKELSPLKSEIKNWDAILFSVFYHDIIYKATSKENEELSADLAKERLYKLAVPKAMIEACHEAIIATKHHNKHLNKDINLLTDADLAILGSSDEIYTKYIKNIRKEYSIFPDFLYNKGRKKVLKHFLEMDTIYKTEYFKTRYNEQAIMNLTKEIQTF